MGSANVQGAPIDNAIAHLKNEQSPIYFLLLKQLKTMDSVRTLQGATAEVAEDFSNTAQQNINAGNTILGQDMKAVQAADGSTEIQQASNVYATDSQQVTNTNNGFNTIVQTSQTTVSDLSRQQANVLESSSAVLENMSGLTSLLAGWAGG